MTFPAIIYATASPVSGAAALAVALFFAYKGKSLFQVSIAACAIVFILEFSYNIIALTWKICHWQVLTSE